MNGTYTMAWDPNKSTLHGEVGCWYTLRTVCGAHKLELYFYCGAGGITCPDFRLDMACDNVEIFDFIGPNSAGCTCDPLNAFFQSQAGCGCPVTNLADYTVTL